jgi:hypothetical protein
VIDGHGPADREEADRVSPAQLLYVLLDARTVAGDLLIDVDEEVQIVVDVVVLVDVFVPAFALGVEFELVEAADVAFVLNVFFELLVLLSLVAERVDDDAEDDVEYEDHDDDEEGEVEHESLPVVLPLC